MKPYQVLMGVALVGAAGLLLWGDPTPSGELAEPAPRHAAPAAAANGNGNGDTGAADSAATTPAATRNARAGAAAADATTTAILALLPRAQLLGEAGEGFGADGAVFQGQNWNPPPPPVKAERPPPPPPPTAPPLPFTILGKAVSAGAWEVFLARGDKTYVARLNEVIDGTYRVDRIAPPLLMLTYLPLNQTQQVNIGVSD
ncbi:hypothetical protein [Rugamonas rubra]|uniref:Prolin-rich transmembrane protein n=1 Tax=Rugamonas rubra TaxID=758825 RepID=A0A1I4L2Z9_9BURK|nr:hypothetical protein [Rugamonas rubra]SFL85037.1 hypothetical protein SAMN02982985_01780 [Rugamonas rubra]